MLKELKKHEDKGQGKTKHESPRSINHKATQSNHRLRTVSSINYRGFKDILLSTNLTLGPDVHKYIKRSVRIMAP